MPFNWKKWSKFSLGGLEPLLDLSGDLVSEGTFSKVKNTIKKV
ncbi:MAG: hypothetical protein mread185_000458 [Mycoplasmataceae bacterium]|nr:MAG: hypothetical protein mread185_000458 [Mycoplasmataceae bacterium]